ncbi:hypothetical protein [Enterobacter hormaechei]|uniref:hypothetical protein n=1 Tax=Enterobacter hormaechei TaxID=158836 RepID=UPI000699DA74|nr:hypothetical protein [Enterobacter hormaechei]
MSNIDKQALKDEAISKAFAGTNFGRDDFKNILAETVIDAAAGWRCGFTATTICTQLGLLTPKGCASALGLRFISEHVQRETKRLKDELEAAEKRIAELQAPAPELKMAHLINKFYERYPLAEFKSDTERSAALGYFMAGAELQCFGEFINYAELMGDE